MSKIRLTEEELRSFIAEVINEDMMPPAMHPATWDANKKPPVPPKKAGGSSGTPNLKAFKADCNMMADAASRVKQILDANAGQGNTTKEALQWLEKVIKFATSAKASLGQKG